MFAKVLSAGCPGGCSTSNTKPGSCTIVPSAPRHCPCVGQTVKPYGKRGVTTSARKTTQAESVTVPPVGILRPKNKRSDTTAVEEVGDGCGGAGAGLQPATAERVVAERRNHSGRTT